MTTLRRERRLKFIEILSKYYVGINEDVLNELLDAAESRTERKTDDTKGDYIAQANKKVDAILGMGNFPGAKKEIRVDSILSYLAVTLHRTTTSKEWLEFAKWIDNKQQKEGEKVEMFVAWLLGQPNYDPQYWPVKKMMEFWPQAFVKSESNREEGKSFYV